jgi:hypothetical protein
MMVTDEQFFAWLDGELGGEEADRVAADVAANPALAQKAEEHRALRAKLRRAFDPIAAAPVPDALLMAASEREPGVVDFGKVRRARDARRWAPQWLALAATLAVGIFLGTMVPGSGGGPIAVDGGKLYAAAGLDRALSTQLASAPSGEVRIGLTFRDRSGTICRSFADQAAAGLACRSGDRWQLRGLFAAPEGQAGDYRMAAGMDPDLAALVGTIAAGEPFDAVQEKAARDKGWR